MTRFFSFGCSFTQNAWPTWSDCLGPNFDQYENWGFCGAGNHYIFNSVVECNQRNRFTKNDTIIVQWTSSLREDRYMDLTNQFKFKDWPVTRRKNTTGWITPGNITSQNFFDDDFIYKYVLGSEKGFFIRDMAYIQSIRSLLESTGCTWKFISMLPMTQLKQENNSHMCYYNAQPVCDMDVHEVVDLYSDTLASILPSFFEVLFQFNWNSRRPYYSITDHHPLPIEAVEYLDIVLPEFPVCAEVREYCIQSTQALVDCGEPLPFSVGENHLARRVAHRL